MPRSHSPGDDQGRQQGPDEGHDQGEEAGHEEVPAVHRVVEPDPVVDCHPGPGRLPALDPTHLHPGGHHAPDIVLDQAGAVGVHAVEHELHRGPPPGQDLGRKAPPDTDDPVDPPPSDPSLGLGHGGGRHRREIARQREAGGQIASGRPPVLDHEGHGNRLGVQGDPVAEEEEQHHRHHDTQKGAAGVPEDLTDFLSQKAGEPHPGYAAVTHGPCLPRSDGPRRRSARRRRLPRWVRAVRGFGPGPGSMPGSRWRAIPPWT